MDEIEIPHVVMRDRRLSAACKLLFGAIVRRFGDGDCCRASYSAIAADVGLTRRHAIRCVHKLQKLGFIDVDAGNDRTVNTYRVDEGRYTKAIQQGSEV